MEKQLPKNWTNTELSYLISHVIGGDWGKEIDFTDEDYVEALCIRGSEIKNWTRDKGSSASLRKIKKSSLESRKLELGDILLEISGGGPEQPVGRTVIIDFEALAFEPTIPKVCTNFLRLLRLDNKVNSKFINHYLQFFYNSGEITKYQGGSNNLRNLKFKEYETIKIPLPPLTEQNRIVTKLDTLFAQLETIKRSMANVPLLLKDFRQQVLNQAVTGKLTEEWRKGKELEDVEKYILRIKKRQEKELVEQQELNLKLGLKKISKRDNKILPDSEIKLSIPENWRVSRIADVITDLTDYHANGSYIDLKANVTLKEEPDYACMIRSTNFEKNNFDSLMIYINEQAYNYMSRSKLFGNEILISKIGNAGSVYLMPFLNRPASLAMNLFAIRIDSEIEAKYIYFHLLSDFSTTNISKYVRGVATKSIDKISVRSLMIGLPSNKEQQEIVSRIESLFATADVIEKQYESLKAKIDNLPQALLHKAFKGELTEQLESDGDARELLKEIEELKKETAKSKKK